jgi:TfoX/Sxy family transcriptional regulator of competence genes
VFILVTFTLMASDKKFVEFVVEQIKRAGTITAKSMFGEYGVYADEKLFALICDNKLFIKPTEPGRAFIKHPVEAPPYPGAKNCFLIEDKLEDWEWLSELVKITVKALPAPKIKKPKKKK